ncbi:hypothetical protein QJS10_CPA07g00503 [Acorus calamus]|uniref:Uncharacterized protein n=1 Tax=Acorus calamus TaxID=4465 RepID=A0AAV9EGA8_ACOCL|nr:hypothetical protein QJS10_CPA07g00503 [Acorus calamus]
MVNTIRSLRLPDGDELTDPVSIKEHIVDYFTTLLNRDSGFVVPTLQSYGSFGPLSLRNWMRFQEPLAFKRRKRRGSTPR